MPPPCAGGGRRLSEQAERGLKGPLNAFIHTSRGGQAGPYADGDGEVMQRLLAEKSRFDFMEKTMV